jgi:hypothetical protein
MRIRFGTVVGKTHGKLVSRYYVWGNLRLTTDAVTGAVKLVAVSGQAAVNGLRKLGVNDLSVSLYGRSGDYVRQSALGRALTPATTSRKLTRRRVRSVCPWFGRL